MTDYCTIGPVSIDYAGLFEGNTFSFSNSATNTVAAGSSIVTRGQYDEEYGFDILCTHDEALQLKGLLEQGEILWLNANSDLTDNDYVQHKGWVLLTNLTMELETDTLMKCSIDYIKISDYENEYFTMDYSRGIYDGVNIEPVYTPTNAPVYQLQEDGTDETTHWTAAKSYSGTMTMSSPASNIILAAAATTDGIPMYGWAMCESTTNHLQEFTPPFTFETVLERPAFPAGYQAEFGIAFTTGFYGTWDKRINTHSIGNWFETCLSLGSSSFNTMSRTFKGTNGVPTYLATPRYIGGASTAVGVKIIFEADGKVRIYTDYGLSGTWYQEYYGPSQLTNYKNGLYLYLWVKNRDSTVFNASYQKVEVYNTASANQPNVVMLPPGAINLSVTQDGTRTVEDGTAGFYVNPTTDRRYQIPTASFYNGSVKVLSSNNATTTSRQVYGTEVKLTPTTTIIKNGMTQLTFDADQVILSAWYGGAYVEFNRMHYTDDIDYLKLLFNNSERVVLQVNDTKYTMLRSSPIVTIEQPNTDLGNTLNSVWYHGDATSGQITTTGLTTGQTVTMDSETLGYYATGCNRSINMVTANIATGSDTGGNTTGFTATASTVTSSTDQAYQGSKSIKTVTNNIGAGEGVKASVTGLSIGQQYTIRVKVKGTAGVILKYGVVGVAVEQTALTGGWDTFTLTQTATSTSHTIDVLTNAKVSTTFYTDEYIIINGASIPTTKTMDVLTGNLYDNVQTLVVNRDVEDIEADNLPATDVRGVGWVSITATGYNAASSLALQWYRQTRTGISMKQII